MYIYIYIDKHTPCLDTTNSLQDRSDLQIGCAEGHEFLRESPGGNGGEDHGEKKTNKKLAIRNKDCIYIYTSTYVYFDIYIYMHV